ncbi:hypothetical protein FVW20_00570 [Desulfovibrio oxamicus]|uniref:Uncharacterized protein n=1 Tax=Nitratidesulfovibrio oxamicus TaxID=32016 RepID=A0ABS0IZF9_9BACT|nr:hypothetical protein [Nitratidesulfovibrio oxamicus]MBG3875557.1 hypothetical protein [Nitratidesulfovibrio oxamicus]
MAARIFLGLLGGVMACLALIILAGIIAAWPVALTALVALAGAVLVLIGITRGWWARIRLDGGLRWRGYFVGWSWVHSNGIKGRNHASIASYHHPRSITWRWSLWLSCAPRPVPMRFYRGPRHLFFWRFQLRWQDHMWMRG